MATLRGWTARHRFALLAAVVAMAYAILRLDLGVEYRGATWQQLYELSAPLPFGHRVLVPLLCRPLVSAGILLEDSFFLYEALATFCLLIVLRRLFLAVVEDDRWAKLLAFAFVAFLPGAFLVTVNWPAFFYPYDTPAMLFVALGLLLMVRKRWAMLAACVAVAALNRETAVLIPGLFGLLYLRRLPAKIYAAILLAQVAAFAAVQGLLGVALSDNARPYGGSLAWMRGEELRLSGNLRWLGDPAHDLLLLASLGFLPLIYLGIRRHVAPELRRLVVIPFAYFLALLFVGNPYEPRIFAEILVVAWFCAASGIPRFVNDGPGMQVGDRDRSGARFSNAIERYGVLLSLAAFGAACMLAHFWLGGN